MWGRRAEGYITDPRNVRLEETSWRWWRMEKRHAGGKSPEEAMWMDRWMEEVEVKGQAPGSLYPRYQLNSRQSRPVGRHRSFGEKQNLLLLTLLEKRFLDIRTRSIVTIKTRPVSLFPDIFLFLLHNVKTLFECSVRKGPTWLGDRREWHKALRGFHVISGEKRWQTLVAGCRKTVKFHKGNWLEVWEQFSF